MDVNLVVFVINIVIIGERFVEFVFEFISRDAKFRDGIITHLVH